MINLGIIIKHDLDNNIPIATGDELNLSPMGLSTGRGQKEEEEKY